MLEIWDDFSNSNLIIRILEIKLFFFFIEPFKRKIILAMPLASCLHVPNTTKYLHGSFEPIGPKTKTGTANISYKCYLFHGSFPTVDYVLPPGKIPPVRIPLCACVCIHEIYIYVYEKFATLV